MTGTPRISTSGTGKVEEGRGVAADMGHGDKYYNYRGGGTWNVPFAQESFELTIERFDIPKGCQAQLQKPNCEMVKAVRATSGCAIRPGEDEVSLVFAGLRSEFHAAKMLLAEEMPGSSEPQITAPRRSLRRRNPCLVKCQDESIQKPGHGLVRLECSDLLQVWLRQIRHRRNQRAGTLRSA